MPIAPIVVNIAVISRSLSRLARRWPNVGFKLTSMALTVEHRPPERGGLFRSTPGPTLQSGLSETRPREGEDRTLEWHLRLPETSPGSMDTDPATHSSPR